MHLAIFTQLWSAKTSEEDPCQNFKIEENTQDLHLGEARGLKRSRALIDDFLVVQ